MTKKEAIKLVGLLKEKNIEFTAGLTDKEVLKIQKKFKFQFPPDLKLFLQTALPISEGFYNWRKFLSPWVLKSKIKSTLNWPLRGMLYDIENDGFWLKAWGEKPEDLDSKLEIAEEKFKHYPKLIPIYSHRYISEEPAEENNPIYSVYQMDIIYYGYNLADYLANEFKFELPTGFEIPQEPKEIRFWTQVIELNSLSAAEAEALEASNA